MMYNLPLLFYFFVVLASALFMYYIYAALLEASTSRTKNKTVDYTKVVGYSRGQRGFTLIELIIFIVGLGILASTVLLPLIFSLQSSPKGFNTLAAYEIAKGRMELIRMQSRTQGFANTADICASSPPAVCSASTPAGYTVTSVIGAAPAPNNDTTQYKQVTVIVQGNSSVGNGYAQLVSIVANY